MKNWEKYEEEIKAIGINNLAVAETGEAKQCMNIGCDKCKFSDVVATPHSCYKNMVNWLYEEYKEPEIDWSKVPVDTPIYVKNISDSDWKPRHFAKYEDGQVHTWAYGTTSFSALHSSLMLWKYAKLAEDFNNVGGYMTREEVKSVLDEDE